MRSGREFLSAASAALACVGMLVTLLAHQAHNVLVSPSGFSDRAVSLVRTEAVDALVAGTVTARFGQYVGGQASVQPVVQSAVRRALASPPITTAVRTAAESLQRQLVSGQARTLNLTLPGIGPAVASRIGSVSPRLAAAATQIGTVTVLDVPIPSAAATAIHDIAAVGRRSSLLLVITVALVLVALALSPDRRGTIRALGLGAVASGLLAVAVYFLGRGLIASQFSGQDAQTTARAAWSVYLGGLETSGFVLAGGGAVAALAATLV